MRYKFFPLFVVVLVCAFAGLKASAQTVAESESSVTLSDKTADVSLVIDSQTTNTLNVDLAILDDKEKVRSDLSQQISIKVGKHIYKFQMPIDGFAKESPENIAWYRLQYRIGENTGIVSLSELMKDVFDLRAAAPRNVFAGMTYRVRVRTLHPFTKQAVKHVAVNGKLELDLDVDSDDDKLTLNASATTNAQGFAILDFKIPENAKLDYDGDLKLTANKNGVVREIDEDLYDSNNEPSMLFTTDKPIYQPGQEFHARGLLLDVNHMVIPGKEVELKIFDEEDTLLYKETVTTSEYGIAAISWNIPENIKLGNYRLQAEDCSGCVASFRISRYDLPNFSVTATPDKSFYLLDDKQANVTVKADYLFGKPVTKGKVRVVEESSRHWNWSEQKYDIDEKNTFEGETDGEGKFIAKIDLEDDESSLRHDSWERFKDLNFTAYFTDPTTNRTEQRRFSLRISKEPIHIYLIRYADQNSGLPVTAYLSTFYADGTPAICDVSITGNYENSPLAEDLTKLKTNSFGAGKFRFSFPPQMNATRENYFIHITARDKNGKTGTYDENFYVRNGEDSMRVATEKAVYIPGEPVEVNLVSTRKHDFIYVDVVKDWSVLSSYYVELRNGKANLTIPYDPKFKGDLTISAYTDEKDSYEDSGMRATRGIIFPAQENLQLNAKFSSKTYRPNEEAILKFSVADSVGHFAESALGVVVFDKAIEERARTDADFGSYFSRYSRLLGYDTAFGDLTLKDLNGLDISKPISPEMQLAAEVMLAGNYYYPSIYHSEFDDTEAKSLYEDFFRKQLVPVETTLNARYAENYTYPNDNASLKSILSKKGIDFDSLKDPWGQNYVPVFSIERSQAIVTLKTSGADKKPDTSDDFNVSSSTFNYFTERGLAIDKAISEYHKETGNYVRDLPTLTSVLAKKAIDLSKLKDAWGRDYRITFEISGRSYIVRFHSDGPNGINEEGRYFYNSDDFDSWKNNSDYFYETENRINQVLGKAVNVDKHPFPATEAEFTQMLKDGGVDMASVADGYGRPAYLSVQMQTVYADKTVIENGKQKITPVTNQIRVFHIRSRGADAIQGTSDDFDLATFSSVVTEASKDTEYSKADVRNIAYSGSRGAIGGKVVDPMDAIIPGASITITSEDDGTKIFKGETDANGDFVVADLPSGKYSVKAYSSGFKAAVLSHIEVRSQNLTQVNITLSVGAVNEVVTVSSDVGQVNTSSATVGRTVTSSRSAKITFPYAEQNSTPRLRQYFPETLFWNPELITDKKGKAEVKFKLADNITTWKMYTIASTKNGKVGMAEKEVTAFQPFFVDLDPPKFLTTGDEIFLPTQVRNYTEKQQKVDVTMDKADWFSMLSDGKQQVNVAAGDSQNAVFGFKATTPVKNGKQRVTAIAQTDSDAIEKPVTVRPDGEEIVRTDSNLFTGETKLNVDFPANALANTQKAELKIYPNLYSQIEDSINGLLERPYGCGEQTISSTYPNLMILKFVKPDSAIAVKAKKFLRQGYERLIGYQSADGGFTYWGGKSEPDIALTAYALRFLTDASSQIDVDDSVIERAQKWLVKQQRADGSWTKQYPWEKQEDLSRTKMTTTYIARSLAMLRAVSSGKEEEKRRKGEEETGGPLTKALAYLKTRNAEIDEPYALALFGLASLDSGDDETASKVAKTLERMAITEGSAVYWKLETNTPFYGWGTAGRVETTALVTQLLVRLQAKEQAATRKELINKATLFLLKNKDRYGVWYSTQTTINVLDAFLATIGNDKIGPQKFDVSVNGIALDPINVAADRVEPITLDLTGKLASDNHIEVRATGDSPVITQIVATHYINWKDSTASGRDVSQSRALRLDYKCDKQQAAIMEEVKCSVEAERVGFRGYGMLLAEIGTPPGADVSSESLEKAMESDWSVSHYEILPDRILVYMWAHPGSTKFNFTFRPRYGINAQTPASVVYDYYNPEAQATVTPIRFVVKL